MIQPKMLKVNGGITKFHSIKFEGSYRLTKELCQSQNNSLRIYCG